MTRAEMRAESERLMRQVRYGKAKLAITRCPPGAREYDSIAEKRGGTLPGRLDPRTLPDNPADEAFQRAVLQEHCS